MPERTAKTTSSAGRRSPHLERDKVVLAALVLLNEVGFEGMTLRKLADKLGVKAAALYWHFENKQDLIDQVAGAIINEEMQRTPLPDGAQWREVLTVLAYATRDAFMRYRDGALVIASADLSKSATLQGREVVTSRLLELGMAPGLVTFGFFAVSRYTLGCALEEQADPYTEAERLAISHESFPHIAAQYPAVGQTIVALHEEGVTIDADTLFQQGLDILLDGIAARFNPTQS